MLKDLRRNYLRQVIEHSLEPADAGATWKRDQIV
jgi:hypothetical protein